MSSPFLFRQRRILVSVLTVAAVVFSPAPIVAQPISRLLFFESPKPSVVLRGSKEFGKTLGSWGQNLGSTWGGGHAIISPLRPRAMDPWGRP